MMDMLQFPFILHTRIDPVSIHSFFYSDEEGNENPIKIQFTSESEMYPLLV